MTRAGLLTACLVTLLALPGCIRLGGEPVNTAAVVLPDPAQFTGAILENIDFVTSDGVNVHATVYLPKGAPEGARFGTIVHASPYFDNLYRRGTHQLLEDRKFEETTVGLYVGHGFAYVATSVPGTGQSGGCFDLGGMDEQRRLVEFVEWAAQQPWSNGNVGMIGVSYDGTTPWEVAIHAPSALKTIVPIAGITDWYNYEYQNGAPYAWWGPLFLPNYLLTVGWGANPYWMVVNPNPQMLAEDACPEAKDHFLMAGKTWATGVYDAFWHERNYTAHMDRIKASVLLVHGLQDWNVKPDHADVWEKIPTEKHAWLVQMEHNLPWRNSFNRDWSRPDWNATAIAWFDHYLNGVENGIPHSLPPVWVQDSRGNWRSESRWPPASAATLKLHLAPGRLQEATPRAGTPPSEFATAPGWTSLHVEPDVGTLGPESPPGTFAMFLTEPVTEDVRIAGVPEALLYVDVDRPGYAKAVVKMFNVSEDGRWWWINMGGRGLAQRDGRTHDDAVEPGVVMQVPVAMHPAEAVIHKGERIALLVAGDDPEFFHANGHAPQFRIFHDAQHPSHLALPVLPADAPPGLPTPEVPRTNPYYVPPPAK